MQIFDRVPNCNGCAACVVACKYNCMKMHDRKDESIKTLIDGKVPTGTAKPIAIRNEGGCFKCNACVLFCPIFNPVEMPEINEFYEYDEKLMVRDMPPHYREVMRQVRDGRRVEFVGTLCQIVALKSLLGGKDFPNLIYRPMYCSENKRTKDPVCKKCHFYDDFE